MSKMDDLRAMREARFAQNAARAKQADPAGPAKPALVERPPVAPDAKPDAKPAKKASTSAKRTQAGPLSVVPDVPDPGPADVADEAETEELCGHRAISGRTCTRERGHAAQSHRYS